MTVQRYTAKRFNLTQYNVYGTL